MNLTKHRTFPRVFVFIGLHTPSFDDVEVRVAYWEGPPGHDSIVWYDGSTENEELENEHHSGFDVLTRWAHSEDTLVNLENEKERKT